MGHGSKLYAVMVVQWDRAEPVAVYTLRHKADEHAQRVIEAHPDYASVGVVPTELRTDLPEQV